MAEDLTVSRPVIAPKAEEQQKRRRVHSRKFMVAYMCLGLALLGAAVLVAVAMTVDSDEERAWSAWQPSGEGEARIWEIADQVGRNYRASDGQLAARILAGPPTFNTADEQGRTLQLPIEGVLVKGRATDQSDARATLFSGDSVMYALCGTGDACQPGTSLLRLEELGTKYERLALELALYTFKYVDGVNGVIVYLPPLPNRNDETDQIEQLRTIVYLERGDVEFQLEQPVTSTLSSSSGLDLSQIEQAQIIRLVHPKLYTFEPEQAPNGAWILSLERFEG